MHGELDSGVPVQKTGLVTDGDHIARSSLNEKKASSDYEGGDTPDGEEPNDHEKRTLRRIGENLPMSAFLIAIVELTERFTYYGAQGLFQNYINNKPNGADGARGLGLGHQGATGLNIFFQFFCYGKYWPCMELMETY